MLPRMQPREFYDLVIEVAIIRPGPIQGGMINPYLRRRQGLEAVTYPSPEIEAVLRRTLGVPIFQEQVMSIAMTAAGFTAGEADRLRRAMAAWKRKGGLEQFEDQLMSGMAERGYSLEFATSIVGQIRGFAEYGFPESHAHSFALLAYASSWLKCHHPAEFLAALLNSQPMGFYSCSSLVQDARRHDVEVRPVDVCTSGWEASLEPMADGRLAVRLGLNNINGMVREAAWRIEEARAAAPFKNTRDVAMRAQLDAGDMKALASANALVTLTGNRRMAMWDAAASVPERDLMRATTIAEPVLELAPPTEADDIVADYRHLGLTLGRHPLALLRERLNKMRFVPSDILNTFSDGQLARGCGIVTVRQRPETAKGVIFLTLEDEFGTINIIVWPTLVEKQRAELMNASLLGVYGIWQSKSGVRNLIAKRLVDCSHLLGQLDTRSRNFH
jgi:error-prone DNA polymerase